MAWNFDSIQSERSKINAEKFSASSRDEMLEHINTLETALYPFAYVFGSLNEKPPRGMVASSKLFPFSTDQSDFLAFNSETRRLESVDKPTEDQLHTVEYSLADSIVINDGTKLADDFEVFEVHQYFDCATAYCGAIDMGDIRRAAALLFPPPTNPVR